MITKMSPSDSEQVAYLHMNYLHSPFKGNAGIKLLKIYYTAMCAEQGACGYVAKEKDNILGYVCGVWDSKELQKLMLKRFWYLLLLYVLYQNLIKPEFIMISLRRILKRSPSFDQRDTKYELRPIVILPQERGSGLAEDLVNVLLRDASDRGFERIHLYAEESNRAAVKFYQNYGFRLVRQEYRDDQVLQIFEHSTGKKDDS